MGVALGCIGLSLDDFLSLEVDEFEHICRAWHDMTEGREHSRWERARMAAAITIQPHVRRSVRPDKLLPFPWEKKPKAPTPKPVSQAQAKERFTKLMSRAND